MKRQSEAVRVDILNLRDCPDFADILVDRGWHAWWTDSGLSPDEYRNLFNPVLEGDGIPFALVAHENGRYLGSVLVIEDDLDERPQYAPWIAALWVEPGARRQGIAAKLIAAARVEAARCGQHTCYLCAAPEKTPYYLARGFRLVESGVSDLDIFQI